MNSSFYTELANMIYRSEANNQVPHQPEAVTLTESTVINGKTFDPGITLNILRPAIHRR